MKRLINKRKRREREVILFLVISVKQFGFMIFTGFFFLVVQK